VAGGVAFGARAVYGHSFSPFSRLALESAILLVTFVAMLLFVTGQKALYLDLFRGLKLPSRVKEEKSLASA
jgi:PST family polysaccharide transporter